MAQPGWDFQDGFQASMLTDESNVPLDDDVLNAALEFLEGQDHDLDSPTIDPPTNNNNGESDSGRMRTATQWTSSGEDTSGEEASGSSPLRNIRDRVATHRRPNKQKEEISLLRAEADALQARLEAMQKQPLRRGPFMIAPLGSTWEDTAANQREEREHAERENKRLKHLLGESKRIAKALRRAATRETNAKVWDPLRRPPALPQVPVDKGIALQDPGVFDVLIASLGPMLWQTDSMVTAGLHRHLINERHGDSHLTIKLQDSRIVPVGVMKTAAVMWDHSLLQDDLKELRWKPLGEDTFQSQFIAHSVFPGFEGHALGKLVARRVVEANRVIILRHSLFQCLSSTHKNRFVSVPMRHFLWTVIDRPPNLASIPGEDSISRIQTCAVSLPRLDVGDLNDPTRAAEIDTLIDMVNDIAIQQCDQTYDVVDNMLLGRVSDVDMDKLPTPSPTSEFTRSLAQGAY